MEVKFVDTAISGDVNSTPVVTLLNGVAQGSGVSARIANKTLMVGVNVRLHVTNETAVRDRLSAMRVVLVLDHQTNKAALTTTDVLEAATMQAQQKWENQRRFTVLTDEVVSLNTFGGSATGADVYHWVFTWEQDLWNVVRYTGSGSTVANIVDGSLYLIYFGPDAAGVDDFDCVGTSRVLFVDY